MVNSFPVQDTSNALWTGSPQRVKAGPFLFALIFIVAFGGGFILPMAIFLETGAMPDWISLTINGQALGPDTPTETVSSAIFALSAMLLTICLGAGLYALHKRSERYELFERTATISWTFPFKGRRTVRLSDLREVKLTERFGFQSLSFRAGKAHILRRISRLDFTEFSNLKNAEVAERFLVARMNESLTS